MLLALDRRKVLSLNLEVDVNASSYFLDFDLMQLT